jgi:hypothetical protein
MHTNDGKEIYVKCIPMHWPLDNVPGNCTFECWIRLDGNTAHVRCRVLNHRDDKTQYQGRDQELPAIYTNVPWYRWMTYKGDKPFTSDALSQIPSAFPWSGWQGTENWAALVNDAGWGLGVWEPGIYTFIGGFAGKPGAGGPKDGPTGYIAPLHQEILDHNIDYDYHYVLILDSLEGIRRYVYNHAARPAPPDYVFTQDRQHWHYVNATDSGWPVHGELKVLMEKDDPQMIGPAGFWKAADAPRLYVRAAFHTGAGQATVFWSRADSQSFADAKTCSFNIIPDGQFHTYEVNLAASPEYHGAITRLRLDPEPAGKAGDFVEVKSIGFHKP